MSKHRSLWLQEAGVDDPRPPLAGTARTDVAIVGGGYVGLWTALRLRELDASVRITVLDADVCGGGASGRNGGLVLSWWPKLSSLIGMFGVDEAVRLVRASEVAIDDLEEFCRQHAPEAEFRRSGWLWTATAPAHVDCWGALVEMAQQYRPGVFVPQSPDEVARLSGSPVHLAGVLEPRAATVHPGRLVRAMRRVALEHGITIHENSHVTRLHRGSSPSLETGRGRLHADRVVVATNAWAAGMRDLHLRLFVISSDIVATEPIPDRLEQLGWRSGPTISDSQTLVCYYRTTDSGRVVFGKGGWTIGIGGRIPAAMERHPGRAAMVARDFHRYYPMLRHVEIAHDWAGPIDRTPNGLPILEWLTRDRNIAVGVGWSGNGVGPSVLGGKVLASMVLGRDDEWSGAGLVGAPARYFPPDPIRFVGAHVVREAIIRKERAEALDLEPSKIAALLSRLAPSGLKDKTRH